MAVVRDLSEAGTGRLPLAASETFRSSARGSPSRFKMAAGADLRIAGLRAGGRRSLVVACDAILRAADRPSTFRTGLANGIGPPWFGISNLAASVSSSPAR